MAKRYLAYVVLLAGWIVFCYWLYADSPLFFKRGGKNKSPERLDGLEIPVGFRWKSAVPLAGDGFDQWKVDINTAAQEEGILILRGYYFRDEAEALNALVKLADERISNVLQYLHIDTGYVVRQHLLQEISGDVRSSVFGAFSIERVSRNDQVRVMTDTIELCFPLKDSLHLPCISIRLLEQWACQAPGEVVLYIVGTADATGITEPADRAYERAEAVKDILLRLGRNENQLILSAGQRSDTLEIRNRCVVIYYEKDE